MASRLEAAGKKAAKADAVNQAALEKMKRDEKPDKEERHELLEDLQKPVAKQTGQEKQSSIFPTKFPPLPVPPVSVSVDMLRNLSLTFRNCTDSASGIVCYSTAWKVSWPELQGLWSADVCYDISKHNLKHQGSYVNLVCLK